MKKRSKFLLLLLLVAFCFSANAQTQKCGFEMLFKIRPGMSKMEVLDTVFKIYEISPTRSSTEKLPPYKNTGGDSIIKEIMVYDAVKAVCFHGVQTKFQLEFADNKLFKVYFSTQYVKSAFQDLVANYNDIRSVIKPKWAFEREIKLVSDNLTGFGYDYSKTKKVAKKTEKITLQYVDAAVNNPSGYYVLEIIWANLENTRMEGSNY